MFITRSALLCVIVILFAGSAASQLPGPTPTPTPRPGSRAASVSPIVKDNGSYDRLRAIENITDRSKTVRHPMLDKKTGIYRKPSVEESSKLAVSPEILNEFAALLKLPDSGIVTLNGNSSCFSVSEVVVVSEECAAFSMPGAGTAFSFRIEGYRLPRLADLILHNGIFRADAVLQHVAIVELGNVAIEDVSLGSLGMKYLVELRPTLDGEGFLKFDEELTRGITANGFFYRKGQSVKANITYALRSIAYRGSYFRTIDQVTYDELDFDRRRDVIVVFRVVEYDGSGDVTIAWRRLADVQSPKLNLKN